MDGPYSDFVHLFSFDPIEVHDTHDGAMSWTTIPSIVSLALRLDEADGLHPRMPLGNDAPLLGNLALEEVDLRALGRHRWECVAREQGRRNFDVTFYVVR
jgi:hypothetical protein